MIETIQLQIIDVIESKRNMGLRHDSKTRFIGLLWNELIHQDLRRQDRERILFPVWIHITAPDCEIDDLRVME